MYLLSVGRIGCPVQLCPQGSSLANEQKRLLLMGAELGGNPLTVVFDDFGLLLVVVLLDTVDLYRYLGIHNGVFAFVHLWQLLTRDYLWRKQGKGSGHHLGEGAPWKIPSPSSGVQGLL